MSKHSSLKATGTVGGKRSVLKRFERVKLLKERGEWKRAKALSACRRPSMKLKLVFILSGEFPGRVCTASHFPNTGSLSDVYEPRGFFLPAKESLLFLRM